MKRFFLMIILAGLSLQSFCWGFFGHRLINQYAVFLLPPDMMVFYKPNLSYIYEHAVDPDKRRYALAEEGPRHYIDLDNYGKYPFNELPRKYDDAIAKFGKDLIHENGIVPWHVQTMLHRLTYAFKNKNYSQILKYSSDLGHYIGDAHVPLHASSNHNGQHTDQKGIHGFWESRIPELFAQKQFDFFIGKAEYISDPETFIWERVLESALAADSVLAFEKELSSRFGDNKYAYEERNGVFIRQYSTRFSAAYHEMLNGMVERRMRESIFAVASYWYTAWVNAGQPDLRSLAGANFSQDDLKEFETLDRAWKAGKFQGREHED